MKILFIDYLTLKNLINNNLPLDKLRNPALLWYILCNEPKIKKNKITKILHKHNLYPDKIIVRDNLFLKKSEDSLETLNWKVKTMLEIFVQDCKKFNCSPSNLTNHIIYCTNNENVIKHDNLHIVDFENLNTLNGD